MNIIRIITSYLSIFIYSLIAQDSNAVTFDNTKIMDVPDLSFFSNIYTGLDILEQMDFKPLNNKKIAILTNQTAVNRNGKHILDLLYEHSNSKVLFILAPENGIWGIDDKRATLVGRDNIDPLHNAPIIDLFNTYVYPPHWVMG